MRKITYYTTINISLSLEDYHNAGIASERTREIIESITNPFQSYGYSSGDKLHCSATGINGNWKVVGVSKLAHAEEIVEIIKYELEEELRRTNK